MKSSWPACSSSRQQVVVTELLQGTDSYATANSAFSTPHSPRRPQKQAIGGFRMQKALPRSCELPRQKAKSKPLYPILQWNFFVPHNPPPQAPNCVSNTSRSRCVLRGCRNAPRTADAEPQRCLIGRAQCRHKSSNSFETTFEPETRRERDVARPGWAKFRAWTPPISVSAFETRVCTTQIRYGSPGPAGTAAGVPRWMVARVCMWSHLFP